MLIARLVVTALVLAVAASPQAARLHAQQPTAVQPPASTPQPAPDQAQLQQRAAEGEKALAEGRYADAERAYAALVALSPGTAEVHARLGLIYFQEGKFNEAVPRLREALRLKPTLPKIDTLLAMSLSELGQYKEALPGLEKGFKQSADPVVKRMAGLHLLRAYTGMARDLDAVEVALTLSRLHPKDPEVLYHSGRLFANFAYLQTIELSRVAPDSVWMHQAAGEANESQGLYDAAVREYQQVLALSPNRHGLHYRIGRTRLTQAKASPPGTEQTAAALGEFEQELKIDPTNANAAYEIGELRRKAGDLQQARAYFERAVHAYPDFEEALVGLGRTLVALDQAGLAVAPLRAATIKNPSNDVAWFQLAQAQGALGHAAEQAEALATFKRLRDRKANTPAIETRREVTKQELETPRSP